MSNSDGFVLAVPTTSKLLLASRAAPVLGRLFVFAYRRMRPNARIAGSI